MPPQCTARSTGPSLALTLALGLGAHFNDESFEL